tara:strand:- start:347 stop:1270 length:924 start_codon:yes stop_codon:yes gene_type:complete
VNILVISSNLIGDTVLSSGIVKYYKDKHKNSKFTVIIGPTASQLYKHFPNLENLVVIKKQKFNFHWVKIWRICSYKKWDLIIDFRSSLLSYFLSNNKKIIFKRSNNKHQLQQLSEKFNINDIQMPYVYNNKEEIHYVEKVLLHNNKYVVIAPGANWKPKIWPIYKLNNLIKKLANEFDNLTFLLVGSEKEKKDYFEDVVEGVEKEKIIDLMGKSLTLTCAFMKKSNLFIGNDSGLMHLAVASNISTIGLFGPTNDGIYGPFGKKNFTIRTKENFSHFNRNKINKNKSYMGSIKETDVFNLILENRLL